MFQYMAQRKRLLRLSQVKPYFPLVMLAALAISLVGLFALLNLLFRLGES